MGTVWGGPDYRVPTCLHRVNTFDAGRLDLVYVPISLAYRPNGSSLTLCGFQVCPHNGSRIER